MRHRCHLQVNRCRLQAIPQPQGGSGSKIEHPDIVSGNWKLNESAVKYHVVPMSDRGYGENYWGKELAGFLYNFIEY